MQNLAQGLPKKGDRGLDHYFTLRPAPDLKEKWIQLGADQYYVMGDNRANSEDSRFYGRVNRKDILGHLIK